MKKLFILLIIIASLTKQSQAQCNNAGFETGTFSGWVGGIGYNANSDSSLTITSSTITTLGINSPETGCSFHTLTTAAGGPDPWGGFPMVNWGNYSIRLGGENINTNFAAGTASCTVNYPSTIPSPYSNGEYIEQAINVGLNNMFLTYSYAVILDAYPLPDTMQPYFRIELINANGYVSPCESITFQGASLGSLPLGFTHVTGGTYGAYVLPWQTSTFNLTPYLGQTITLRFTAAGSTDGAHFAYGYVDCSCMSASPITISYLNCFGDTAVLTTPPLANATYSWTGPSIVSGSNSQTATVTASGNYSVTVTNTLGCSYTFQQSILFSPATVSFTLTPDAVVAHTWDAYPTYSANVDSVRWYWGDGTSDGSYMVGFYPHHTYSVPGMYNICVTAYSSCGDSAQSCQNDTIYRLGNNSTYSTMVYINVDSTVQYTTDINKLLGRNALTIYPNPNNGSFVIEPSNAAKQTMQVYDVNGKLVLTQTITGKTTIDASSLNEGVYNISLLSNEGVINKRLVIVR